MTQAAEIKLETLDNGPGVLPFKLGQTRLITHYHTFIQYLEISEIETRISSINEQLDYFKARLDNKTLPIYELQIEYLYLKLSKLNNELQTLEPTRIRRGLINGLGSLIKGLTGNLDHSDAEGFNKAIESLINNDNKIASELNDHISVNKEWMNQYSQIITQLTENQVKLNYTLNAILDKYVLSEAKFLQFAQLLGIITENLDDLYSELIRIENMLGFIRAGSTHHSMISIDNLGYMINRIKGIYGSNRVLDIEFREYYNLIKPGSYFMGKRIVVVFKFPILSLDHFEFYKLSIVPNRLHQTFIPTHPFIATDGKLSMYLQSQCPKIGEYLLCEENGNQHLREQTDCIQSIISKQSFDTTCSPTKITVTGQAMEQLDDRHYTLIFPTPTKVELQCERQEFVSLSGSYLATIPRGCSIRTDSFKITNNEDEVKGQPMKITQIRNDANGSQHEIPHITLSSINLDSLHQLENKILLQNPVALTNVESFLYHTTVPLYTLASGVIVTLIIIGVRRYLNKETQPGKEASGESANAIPGAPEKHETPATFSLKVLK